MNKEFIKKLENREQNLFLNQEIIILILPLSRIGGMKVFWKNNGRIPDIKD